MKTTSHARISLKIRVFLSLSKNVWSSGSTASLSAKIQSIMKWILKCQTTQ